MSEGTPKSEAPAATGAYAKHHINSSTVEPAQKIGKSIAYELVPGVDLPFGRHKLKHVRMSTRVACADGIALELHPDPAQTGGVLILTLEEMREQLVYVSQSKHVVHLPTGRVYTWRAAMAEYSTSRHARIDWRRKERRTPALHAWRDGPARMTVDMVFLAPGLGLP